jgi:hypothetical protein
LDLAKVLQDVDLKKWKPKPEILASPHTPKPMHGTVPREILGQAWWDKTRKEAYASTNYHCIACSVHKSEAKYHKWLEAHEVYRPNYSVGIWKYLYTVPLCHFCHNFIHAGRLQALLERGEIHHHKYCAILKHGDAILAAIGLKPWQPYEGKFAPWSKWRLQIGRKKYKPKFKSTKELEQHFSPMEE